MEPSLFRYIWRHSRTDQLVVLSFVLASLPFYYLSLDLPRVILNQPIRGEGFETAGATVWFLSLGFGVPEFLQGLFGTEYVRLFDGFELGRIGYLLTLSTTLLSLVAINGIFKFQINTLKGRMGERMLRRLRYQLFDRVLRFPTMHFRKVKQAEIATMIKDEVEPLGGFIGDAFVQPAFLGGLAITAMAFIMLQSFWLGVVAGVVVLVQAFLIPKLRKRILELGRQRQLAARALAGRLGEVVDGALEIHAHDTSNLERAEISGRLGRIFLIRFEIYRRKFFVKFLNNFLAQVTPFIFYAGGGYLAITGQMDIGQLVAALVAYKELPGPVKELIDWDQQRLDVQIKYEQVAQQFNPQGMIDPELQTPNAPEDASLTGDIVASSLVLQDDAGVRVIDGMSFTIGSRQHVAITGPGGGGKEQLALLLARLVFPTSGKLTVGGLDMAALPEAVTGRRISYVGGDSILFAQSIRENMLYGLKHRPITENMDQGGNPRLAALDRLETARAGNPDFDLRADWVDYEAAGAVGPYDIDRKIAETFDLVMLSEDVYQLGLRGSIDPHEHAALAENILRARQALADILQTDEYVGMVELFDPEKYNQNATIGENLLFGTPVGVAFEQHRLTENAYFRDFLSHFGLQEELIRMGLAIADTMVELFADLAPGHPFFDQFSFISSDDLPHFSEIVVRAGKLGLDNLPDTDKAELLALPFNYVEARHRLGLIDSETEQRLLAARRNFAASLPPEYAGAVEFYDPASYNLSASLLDNILFGRIVYGQAECQAKMNELISDVVDQLNLRSAIFNVGLEFNVGARGKLLTGPHRQKLALARAILRRPDILVVNEALSALDAAAQRQVLNNVIEASEGRGLIWVVTQPAQASKFDKVLVVNDGRVTAQGDFEELVRGDTPLTRLLAAG